MRDAAPTGLTALLLLLALVPKAGAEQDPNSLRDELITAFAASSVIHEAWTVSVTGGGKHHVELYRDSKFTCLIKDGERHSDKMYWDGTTMLSESNGVASTVLDMDELASARRHWTHVAERAEPLLGYAIAPPRTLHLAVSSQFAGPSFDWQLRLDSSPQIADWLGHRFFDGQVHASEDMVVVESDLGRTSYRRSNGTIHEQSLRDDAQVGMRPAPVRHDPATLAALLEYARGMASAASQESVFNFNVVGCVCMYADTLAAHPELLGVGLRMAALADVLLLPAFETPWALDLPRYAPDEIKAALVALREVLRPATWGILADLPAPRREAAWRVFWDGVDRRFWALSRASGISGFTPAEDAVANDSGSGERVRQELLDAYRRQGRIHRAWTAHTLTRGTAHVELFEDDEHTSLLFDDGDTITRFFSDGEFIFGAVGGSPVVSMGSEGIASAQAQWAGALDAIQSLLGYPMAKLPTWTTRVDAQFEQRDEFSFGMYAATSGIPVGWLAPGLLRHAVVVEQTRIRIRDDRLETTIRRQDGTIEGCVVHGDPSLGLRPADTRYAPDDHLESLRRARELVAWPSEAEWLAHAIASALIYNSSLDSAPFGVLGNGAKMADLADQCLPLMFSSRWMQEQMMDSGADPAAVTRQLRESFGASMQTEYLRLAPAQRDAAWDIFWNGVERRLRAYELTRSN